MPIKKKLRFKKCCTSIRNNKWVQLYLSYQQSFFSSPKEVGRFLFAFSLVLNIVASITQPMSTTNLFQYNPVHPPNYKLTNFDKFLIFDDYFKFLIPCCAASLIFCVCGFIGLGGSKSVMFIFVAGEGVVLAIMLLYTLAVYSGDDYNNINAYNSRVHHQFRLGRKFDTHWTRPFRRMEETYRCCRLEVDGYLGKTPKLWTTCCPKSVPKGQCTNKNCWKDRCYEVMLKRLHEDMGKMRWALWLYLFTLLNCYEWGLCYYLSLIPFGVKITPKPKPETKETIYETDIEKVIEVSETKPKPQPQPQPDSTKYRNIQRGGGRPQLTTRIWKEEKPKRPKPRLNTRMYE